MRDTQNIFHKSMSQSRRTVEEGVPSTFVIDTQSAKAELQQRTEDEIEMETGLKWAARSVASYMLAMESADKYTQIVRFSQGDDYRREAFEHSGEVDDNGRLLNYVKKEVEKVREACVRFVTKPEE